MRTAKIIYAIIAALLLSVSFGPTAEAAAQMKTNGKIAFERYVNGSADIFVMNADGTGQTNLTNTPFNESQAAWSPDGSKLVFVRAAQAAGETVDLYVMDADGKNLKRLTNDAAAERFPAWSPDGALVAYARTDAQGGAEQIYIVAADGSASKNLTAGLRGDHSHPTWSPDSKVLAFTSTAADLNTYEIWLMSADGTGGGKLTDGSPAGSYSPSWSPDGKLIAFQRNYEIYTVDPASGAETNLTQSAESEDAPEWSPDGKQVVFSRMAEGNLDIYAMKADGTGRRRLTTDEQMDNLPAWQQANTQLAFVSTRDGNREIYLMREDGTGITRLTNDPADDTSPALSPDGRRVAFVSNRDGSPTVYVMNADGSGLVRVTDAPENRSPQDESPAWSPDGNQIVFASRSRDSRYQLYVVNADGTGLKKISDGAADDLSPNWSPDGKKIAFYSVRVRFGTFDIFTMNADGTGLVNLTNNDVDESDPVFSPDGTKIAYVNSCCTSAEIYTMNADGSAQTRLTNNRANDRDPSWSPDSTRLVYASMRNASNPDAFAFDLYATAVDGSLTTRLTADGLGNVQPSWSTGATAAAPSKHTIQLTVLQTGGRPLAGATLTLSGAAAGTQTTDAGGLATFANLPAGGTYTVTASKEGYTFKPESRTFENLAGDASGSIEASPRTFTWGGRVADKNGNPLAGVTVRTTGDINGAVETDANGAYAFTIPYGSDVTVSAAHDRYTFNPVGAHVPAVTSDHTTNFTGTLIVYKVGGRVTNAAQTGIGGVTVRLGGAREAVTTTDAGGRYEFSNLPKGGGYTVTPEHATMTFTPAARQIENLGANQTADFQLAQSQVTISGRVRDAGGAGLGGVSVLVANKGGQPSPFYTNAEGFYSAKVLAGMSYTVSASRAHYTFAPASHELEQVGGDRTADFTATRETHNISGRAFDANGKPLSGVMLTLGGSAQATAKTDAEGFFNFTGLPAGGSYTLVPALEGFDFDPAAQTVNDLGGSLVVNFHAAAVVEPARVQFSAAAFKTHEGAHRFEVTVTRTGDASAEGTVFYETLDGTASERTDYTTAVGTLRFAAGEASKTFDLLLTDDAYAEGDEALTLRLSDATGGLNLGGTAEAAFVITDNDAEPGANPAAEAEFFVRQHYHDFLNREPDADGLKFWTDQLAACGGDAGCLDHVRQNVSAAFFLSIEFQQTGYLVHRLQRVSYGQLPRYRDLVRDTQEIGRGVVVGRGDWRERLEANKDAFVAEWAARPEFAAKYAGMSNAQFVDALWSNVGLAPASAAREELIAGLESGAVSRAGALRRVAESRSVEAAEFNSAFVLMEYFGYLRRNPDDRPDADMAGYRFWLDKFNQFGGDYHRAEMVKAFINSLEYQRRFGR